VLGAAGIPSGARPETLPPEVFYRLFRLLA
jgi:hypothetical protein